MSIQGSLGELVKDRTKPVAQALDILSGVPVRTRAIVRYCQTSRRPRLQHLREDEHGSGSAVVVFILLMIVVIVGFSIWLYTEPTWWESMLGRTRWDKLEELFRDIFGT